MKSFNKSVVYKSIYLIIFILPFLLSCSEEGTRPPNIVILYADDLGYGDLSCQNPDSKISTPNLDQLASEGMRFIDAHSSSGICSPSRFALLTGMYHWRRQHGIVGAFGEPFFHQSDTTLAQVLSQNGYTTACIGKWHLGWNWNFLNEPSGEVMQWGRMRKFYQPEDLDWSQPVTGGPLDRGFDYYFGDGTINFPPYTWMENDRIVEAPNENLDINNIGYDTKEGNWEFRPGPKVEGWNPYEVLPTLTKKSVEWIKNQDPDQPFFLYLAFPSPHAPIIPNDEFDGKSRAGAYGDFVFQTDWVAGQVLNALKDKGLEENTIVIFSSDNGPETYAFERAEKYDHLSMDSLRGLKRDVWEGGHRVPLIIKWPGKIKAGKVSDVLISQIDLMPTLAAMAGIELGPTVAPDGYNFLPALSGKSESKTIRDALIHNTLKDKWGVRKGAWLYINDQTGSHSKMPESFKKLRGYEDFETDALLFNLDEDIAQRNNLFEKYPDQVKEMMKILEEEKASGYLVESN